MEVIDVFETKAQPLSHSRGINFASRFLRLAQLLPRYGVTAVACATIYLSYSPNEALALGPGSGEPFADATNLILDTEDTLTIALGDVENDGDIDVVEGKRDGQNRLYLNDGTGALGEGIALGSIQGNSQEIQLADVNSDTFVDMIVADSGGRVRVHTNAASGMGSTNLVSRIDLDSPGTVLDARSLAVGQIDGLSGVDLIVGINGAAEPSRLYLGNNDGTFSAGADIGGTGASTTSIALADVDGVGGLDLIQGNNGDGSGAGNFYYPGDGAGNFGAGVAIGAETDVTRDIAVADVDGVNGPDVVVANIGGPDRVYLNNGAGGFAAPVNLSVSDQSTSVVIFEASGDALLDIVTGISGGPSQLYVNTGGGTFAAGVDVSADTDTTNAIAAGTLDAGGSIDLIEGNNGEPNVLLTNNGTGTFTELSTFMFDDLDAEDIKVADVDGDLDLDVIEAKTGSTNRLYINDGSGNFAEGESFSTGDAGNNSHVLVVDDVNEDTLLDVVVGNGLDQNRVYLGTGGGIFDGGANISGDSNVTRGLIVADLDGVNGPDIVTGNVDAVNLVFLSVAPNSATFAAGVALEAAVTNSTWDLAAGDLDGVNGIDIVVANRGQANRVYLNNGAGGFAAGVALPGTVQASRDVELADLDGDGSLDIVFGNSDSSVNHVYLNNGTGGFPSQTVVSGADANQTWDIDLADVDYDGDVDVIAGNFNGPNRLFLNNGAAAFTPRPNLSSNSFDTQSLATGDIDGDGTLDLVVGNVGDVKTKQLNSNPMTSGLADVVVNENDVPTDVDLTAAFSDAETLIYTVPGNTNPGLVATSEAAGTLTLTYTTDANGTADITVRATDINGLFVESTFNVLVNDIDTVPPVITLLGSDPEVVAFGATYTDPGATALDDVDGNITPFIVTGGLPIDTNISGDYIVTYDVSDAAGNAATQVTRTVTVSTEPDTMAPVITLLGNATVQITVGSTYTDAGATATDDIDGVITGSIVTNNPVDANTAGTYTVTYDVSDSSGNAAAQVTRTVTVAAAPTPTPTPAPSSGGGGGSSGLCSLLGLLSALGMRRRSLSVDARSLA